MRRAGPAAMAACALLFVAWAVAPAPAEPAEPAAPTESAAESAALADPSRRAVIAAARYVAPTTRYGHGVLGDAVEWGGLELRLAPCPGCAATGTVTFTLPDTRVFEDSAPRLADLDGDGAPEVIVVETDIATGAALAIYGPRGKIAQTPPIGRSHRWLAPLGAADLDGDGRVELAYIDRPHLARILRIWRYERGALHPVAAAPGLTNHRIGDATIAGGIRHCPPQPPEIVALSPDWTRLIAARLDRDGRITTRAQGRHAGAESLARALACD